MDEHEHFQKLIENYSDMLKPCPHCGSKAEIHPALASRYAVYCMSDKCGAMLLYTRTHITIPLTQFRALVHRWNRRVDETND